MLLCKKQFPIIFLLFPLILKKRLRNEINFQSNVKFQVQIIIKGNAKLQKRRKVKRRLSRTSSSTSSTTSKIVIFKIHNYLQIFFNTRRVVSNKKI